MALYGVITAAVGKIFDSAARYLATTDDAAIVRRFIRKYA